MKQIAKNCVIVGVGLIGGSLGKAIKKKGLARHVIGVGRSQKSLGQALRNHSIDEASLNLEEAVSNADLVILATPVSSIIPFAKRIARKIPPKCVVSDVASVKGEIVAACAPLFQGRFVGGHPMAGSEKNGVQYANEKLFNNSVCILTKGSNIKQFAKRKVASLWQGVGASVHWLEPKEHDQITASISHFPHLVASLLVLSQRKTSPNVANLLSFSGGGFRDMTRIAASHPELWRDIFFANKKEVIQMINHFSGLLKDWKKDMSQNKKNKILKQLAQAKEIRELLQ